MPIKGRRMQRQLVISLRSPFLEKIGTVVTVLPQFPHGIDCIGLVLIVTIQSVEL